MNVVPRKVCESEPAFQHVQAYAGDLPTMLHHPKWNERASFTDARTLPRLIAVTMLTSHSEQDIAELGLSGTVEQNVARLAALAQQSGMDGVVCSPLEVQVLRQLLGGEFTLVTPGIRPRGGDVGDQKRYTTPAQAIHNGSDYLVIGRPITAASDPMQALSVISAEVEVALKGG